MALPADTLHLDRSDSSADDKTCEDNKKEDAHISSPNVVSISEIEGDLFTCNEQQHNTEIASAEATSDSESELCPLSSIPKQHCTSVVGLSTQTDTKEHAQSPSHTDSHSSNTQASQRTDKRYNSKSYFISGSHSSNASTSTSAAAHTLKTRMGKGLAKLFGERDDDIIALDDIRNSKRTQALTQKYNMLESKVSAKSSKTVVRDK